MGWLASTSSVRIHTPESHGPDPQQARIPHRASPRRCEPVSHLSKLTFSAPDARLAPVRLEESLA